MVNILIIEDHPIVVEGLQKLLFDKAFTKMGQCMVANTVKESIDLLNTFTPELVLLDYNLPDGNGISLCKTIIDKLPNAKILAISSFK